MKVKTKLTTRGTNMVSEAKVLSTRSNHISLGRYKPTTNNNNNEIQRKKQKNNNRKKKKKKNPESSNIGEKSNGGWWLENTNRRSVHAIIKAVWQPHGGCQAYEATTAPL
jgi:hypothetical protein